MNAILIALGAAAAGWAVKSYYEQTKASAQQRALLGAQTLEKGHSYMLQISVDSKKAPSQNLAEAATALAAALKEMGFTFNGMPFPKDTVEAQKFQAGSPSAWALPGAVWNKDEKYVSQGPTWLGMVVAYEMPVTPQTSGLG